MAATDWGGTLGQGQSSAIRTASEGTSLLHRAYSLTGSRGVVRQHRGGVAASASLRICRTRSVPSHLEGRDVTPTEYEHHVAGVLKAEGWDATVTPPRRDFGLDIVGEREGQRLGVQVKMYGAGRPVNAQIVMQLFGAASYQDCTDVMLATEGRVLNEAVQVADKLGIEIRQIPVPDGVHAHGSSTGVLVDQGAWTFDRIWAQHVMHLVGRVLARGNGTTNEVVSVDWERVESPDIERLPPDDRYRDLSLDH